MIFDYDIAGYIHKGPKDGHKNELSVEDLEQLQRDLALVLDYIDRRVLDATTTGEELACYLRLTEWLTPDQLAGMTILARLRRYLKTAA